MSSSISLQIPSLTETLARVRVRFSPPSPLPGVTIYNRARHCCNLSVRAVNSPISELQISAASDVVKEFYDGINRRDLAAVEGLIGEGCVYEDLVFSHPFVGRKATVEFFKKFSESISKDLQFVIDDISNEDSLAVGVTWHLEWKGRPFPFSKGCSFYRLEVLDGKKQIIYGRDCVEPATKPGETALREPPVPPTGGGPTLEHQPAHRRCSDLEQQQQQPDHRRCSNPRAAAAAARPPALFRPRAEAARQPAVFRLSTRSSENRPLLLFLLRRFFSMVMTTHDSVTCKFAEDELFSEV